MPAYLDAILASCSDNLAAIKLQCSDWVVVFQCLRYTACPKIPYLIDRSAESQARIESTNADRLVQTTTDDIHLIKL